MFLLTLEHLKKTMNDSSCNLLLFAAGLGTRLKPFTLSNPKPVLPLFGKAMGLYIFPYLEHLKLKNKVANTFHLPEQIHELYQKFGFSFSNEIDFIKGSGGGLLQAKKQLSQNVAEPYSVLACNADEIFFTQNSHFLSEAFKHHNQNNNFATLIVMKHPEAGHKFGAIWTEKNKVISIGKEKPTNNSEPWHFIGLQFLSHQIFTYLQPDQEQNIFYDVLIKHLNDKKVEIFPIDCNWYETGNLEDYKIAKAEINKILLDQKHPQHKIYQDHFKALQRYPTSQLGDLA